MGEKRGKEGATLGAPRRSEEPEVSLRLLTSPFTPSVPRVSGWVESGPGRRAGEGALGADWGGRGRSVVGL